MGKKITAIKAQQRNPQRVSIFIEDEFSFGLSRIVAAWLSVGQEISDEKIAELKAADEKEIALQKTLNFLSYRARSVAEVRRYLEGRKYPETTIVEILERLQANGLLNDRSFADGWVENRKEFRPRSQRALRVELRQRGVPDEVIEQAVEDVDDEELAYQAGMKQSRRWKDLEWQEFRKKMYDFLLRRGFGYGAISQAVQKVWDAQRMELEEIEMEEDEE